MEPAFPLHRLCPGDTAAVTQLLHTGGMRRRLQDIGLLPGTPVTCLFRSPGGDPTAYRIGGAVIAIRRCDADGILMKE